MIEAKYILTGEVNVATQYIQPNLEEIEITPSKEEQVITPNEDYDGFSKVTVNPILLENIEATPTKEVQTINRSEDKYIESVKVNAIPDEYIVPSGELEITENGQYDVTDKASVNVATSGADLSEYFTESIKSGNSTEPGWIKSVIKLPTFKIEGTNWSYVFAKFIGTNLDLSGYDTSNVLNMSGLFYGCDNLTELNVSNFITSNVNDMNNMFNSCRGLIELDLSNFITSNVNNMNNMFNFCRGLTKLNLSGFDFTNVTSYSSMFGNSASNGVPNNCLIIVKDETAKEWITSKFSRLTNVKTVAEYEAG